MDIVIIGAGPGGYIAALYAAKRGINVALVEKMDIGGTCLNRGCIPTKVILHSAAMLHHVKGFAGLGIDVAVESVNYPQINKRCGEVTARLRGGVDLLLKRAGVTVIHGEASLTGAKQIRVATENGEKQHSADKIVIATGAAPTEISAAPIDGDAIIHSDHALALTDLPESMAIIGGGVIGCEFAQAFARLGCKVTVIEAMTRLLQGMDGDVAGLLLKTLKRDGVKVHLGARVKSAVKTDEGVELAFDKGQGEARVTARKVIVATGRKPKLGGLGLDAAGVAHENGFIKVNGQMQTTVPGIYAIGDVTGGIQLAHTASYGGITAVKHMLGEDADISGACVPMCVYTDPEIACAGLTLDAARKAGFDCREGTFPLSANPRAVIEGSTDGFAKMTLDSDGTIIGAHLVGPNVTEMISLLGGLISFQTAASDMEGIIFAHPSVSEIIGESVLAAYNMALHIP